MKELVKNACSEIGIELNEIQLTQFETYFELLTEWNNKINLTRITEPKEVAVKHFADSLTLLNYYKIPKNARIIDVGTGAGFPGIPLKIARPDIRLTLLDSLNKRLIFLDEVCKAAKINAELAHLRAEEGGRDKNYREKFDLAVARAVARLNTLTEYCLPYIKVGGSFAAMKGPELADELNEAKTAIKTLGGRINSVNEFELKESGRTIVIIDKIKPAPKEFPRHPSKIKTKPL